MNTSSPGGGKSYAGFLPTKITATSYFNMSYFNGKLPDTLRRYSFRVAHANIFGGEHEVSPQTSPISVTRQS